MKTKGLIIFLIIVITVMFFNVNVVQAGGITDIITGADDFLTAGIGENIGIDESKLQSTSKSISNILILLGICVAVIVAAILGIKFMIGSIEEQAKVKEALVPFVIGCIVVFGAFGIWKFFVNVGNDISSTSSSSTNSEKSSTSGKSSTSEKSSTKGGSFHESSSGSSHGGAGF